MADRGVRMFTFDVRLSNTAARSTEWIPIKPGTDGAVALAMCNVIMEKGLYDKDFLEFVKATENYEATADKKVASLESRFQIPPGMGGEDQRCQRGKD